VVLKAGLEVVMDSSPVLLMDPNWR